MLVDEGLETDTEYWYRVRPSDSIDAVSDPISAVPAPPEFEIVGTVDTPSDALGVAVAGSYTDLIGGVQDFHVIKLREP